MTHNMMDEVQLRQQFEVALWGEVNSGWSSVVLNNERDLLLTFPESKFWSNAFFRRTDLEVLATDGESTKGKGFARYSQESKFGALRDVGYHCLGCDSRVVGSPKLILVDHVEVGEEFILNRRLDYDCAGCQTTMFSFRGGDSFKVLNHKSKMNPNVLWGYRMVG